MNGPIAQLVALALHGNAALSGGQASTFLDQNSTALHCQSIVFLREETRWLGMGKPERVVMASPEQWFADLRKRHAKRIGVRWTSGEDRGAPNRMLAGFVGGGGAWFLQVQLSDGGYEQWISRWEVDETRRQKDGKIWKVAYKRINTGRASLDVASLATSHAELKRALVDIVAFARRTDAKPFTGLFEKALATLNDEPAAEVFHRDLYPENKGSFGAASILRASQHAWVFGGMGSWNDLGFEGRDATEYDRVSDNLYHALVRAIPSAVEDR